MNKIYTSIEQSQKLIELGIDVNTADMYYPYSDRVGIGKYALPVEWKIGLPLLSQEIPAWSLSALLKYLSEIKPQVYTQVLFPGEGKWILQFVEYGNGNVCEVSCDNPVDACVEMIEKLHELKIL